MAVCYPESEAIVVCSTPSAGWPIMLGLTAIPAVLELLFLPFFPESPRYMLIQKGDEKNARKGTSRLFLNAR